MSAGITRSMVAGNGDASRASTCVAAVPRASQTLSSYAGHVGVYLHVVGCGCHSSKTGSYLKGSFVRHSENHNRPIYQKIVSLGQVNVFIYWWDDRDGDDFRGWWFGPSVGADVVWAYNKQQSLFPPTCGWHVPWDGPEDTTMGITYTDERYGLQDM